MKRISKKGIRLLLVGVLAMSCLSFTGQINAKNDDVDSKSMPSNGLSISNSDIIGEYDHVVPDFVENENWANEEGSDFTSGNEGQVWTDKSVEKVINKDGQIVQDKFKITLFAKGFPYRTVDENNEKTTTWNNPLANGSTLSITETINNEYRLVDNSIEVSSINNTEDTGLNNTEPYQTEDNKFSLTFNASDVKDLERFNSNDSNSSAFNVKVSFIVEFNGADDNLVANNPYDTGNATSSFEPSKDNYYYSWGFTESSYVLHGLKWNGAEPHWGRIQIIGDILVPNIDGNSYLFDTPDNWSPGNGKQHGTPGQFSTHDSNGLIDGEYKESIINDDDNSGIESVKVWMAFSDTIVTFRIEIYYMNIEGRLNSGRVIALEPVVDLGHMGGNQENTDFALGINSSKTDPIIRKDKDPNGDGIIENNFTNHGQIILEEEVVNGQIEVVKKINASTNNDGQGDPIFIFKLNGTTSKDDKTVTLYKSVRLTGGELSKTVSFTGLEKGIYTVSEVNRDSMRYELANAYVDQSTTAPYSSDNNDLNNSSKTTTFYIGYNTKDDSNTNSNHIYGKVVFENELEVEDNLSDTGIVKNSFKVDNDGKITITKDFLNGEKED